METTKYVIAVDAEALELILAYMDNTEFEEELDPSSTSDMDTLRAKVKLSSQLNSYAESNPAFDER